MQGDIHNLREGIESIRERKMKLQENVKNITKDLVKKARDMATELEE